MNNKLHQYQSHPCSSVRDIKKSQNFVYQCHTWHAGMYLKSGNISMVGSETDKFIKVLYNILLTNYQENMLEKIKGSDFVFDFIDKLYYSCYKTTLKSWWILQFL